MMEIIRCEECGIEYYSETIIKGKSFRHVYPDIVRLETELTNKDKLLMKTNHVHIENQRLQKDLNGELETNQRLTDELTEAQAEVECKDALIEQMRGALKRLCYECEPAGHDIRGCMFKACKWCDAKAALSTAEKGGMSDTFATYEKLLHGVREVLNKEQREKWAAQEKLKEARAEIEQLNKNLRLLLCKEHFRGCEAGLFNSRHADDEPCLMCLMEAAEGGE